MVSEKPLNKDIVIIYKEDEKFKYDVVNPILKKDSSDCVSELALLQMSLIIFIILIKEVRS